MSKDTYKAIQILREYAEENVDSGVLTSGEARIMNAALDIIELTAPA